MKDVAIGFVAKVMSIPSIDVLQPRGQCITLLLAALAELQGRVTKREAITFISERRWFATEPNDLRPYPSQTHTREPRWHTLIAWARKDSTLRDLVLDHERDAWAISRAGIRKWDALKGRFADGSIPVGKGYLWAVNFKRYLYPAYEPASSDAIRPWNFYDDLQDYSQSPYWMV